MSVLERDVEAALVKRVNALPGARCAKFVSPGWSGVPDRIILLNGGRVLFVEVKAPGKEPRTLQRAVHKTLKRLKFDVYVVDGPAGIEKVLSECRRILEKEERKGWAQIMKRPDR